MRPAALPRTGASHGAGGDNFWDLRAWRLCGGVALAAQRPRSERLEPVRPPRHLVALRLFCRPLGRWADGRLGTAVTERSLNQENACCDTVRDFPAWAQAVECSACGKRTCALHEYIDTAMIPHCVQCFQELNRRRWAEPLRIRGDLPTPMKPQAHAVIVFHGLHICGAARHCGASRLSGV